MSGWIIKSTFMLNWVLPNNHSFGFTGPSLGCLLNLFEIQTPWQTIISPGCHGLPWLHFSWTHLILSWCQWNLLYHEPMIICCCFCPPSRGLSRPPDTRTLLWETDTRDNNANSPEMRIDQIGFQRRGLPITCKQNTFCYRSTRSFKVLCCG